MRELLEFLLKNLLPDTKYEIVEEENEGRVLYTIKTDQENIGMIKKGAYLINTARGAVVETDALVDALKSGVLAGAALDVLEEEGELADEAAFLTAPHPREEELKIALANHYLISHPRVIVTPHLAFNTQEAVERILNATIENIQHFAAGSPTNIVKMPV